MNSALKFTQATSIILIPTSTMLDPTCGSGSAVRAAEITRGEAPGDTEQCSVWLRHGYDVTDPQLVGHSIRML